MIVLTYHEISPSTSLSLSAMEYRHTILRLSGSIHYITGTIHMWNRSIGISLVLLLALAAGAAGTMVSLSPGTINRGDTVTIAIQDLGDNTTFSIGIEGRFGVQPGEEFTFETSRFVMPFALESGQIRATLYDTDYNILEVKKNDTTIKKVGNSVNGVFSTSESGSIPAGTYDYLKLSGTPSPGASVVSSGITLEGTKQGPDDSVLSFVVGGITDGTIGVTIRVDGDLILDRTIIIGNGVPSGTVFPTTLPVTTSPPSSGGGAAGGGAAGSVSASPVTTIQTTAVPTTLPGNEPLMTYASGDVTTVPAVEQTPMHTAVTTPATTRKTPLGILAMLGSLCLAGLWAFRRR
jgi:hypothetical protein